MLSRSNLSVKWVISRISYLMRERERKWKPSKRKAVGSFDSPCWNQVGVLPSVHQVMKQDWVVVDPFDDLSIILIFQWIIVLFDIRHGRLPNPLMFLFWCFFGAGIRKETSRLKNRFRTQMLYLLEKKLKMRRVESPYTQVHRTHWLSFTIPVDYISSIMRSFPKWMQSMCLRVIMQCVYKRSNNARGVGWYTRLVTYNVINNTQ